MSRRDSIFDNLPDLIEDSDAPWDLVLSEDYHVKVDRKSTRLNSSH